MRFQQRNVESVLRTWHSWGVPVGRRLIVILVLFPVLGCTLGSPHPQWLQDRMEPEEELRAHHTQRFSDGDRVERVKLFDPADLTFRNITWSSLRGSTVQFIEVRSEKERQWRARHGNLHHTLVSHLSQINERDATEAEVWVQAPAVPPLRVSADSGAEWDAQHATYLAARRAAVAPAIEQVAQALRAAGVVVKSTQLHPPVLRVSATRALLEDTVAFLPGVQQVHTVVPFELLSVDAAEDLVQERLWLPHVLGAGQDLRIVVVEPRACINTKHNDFQFVRFEAPELINGEECRASAGLPHSTAVAGMLATARGQPGGPWRFSGLFAGRLFESETLSDEVLLRHPHFINLSVTSGGPTGARRTDQAVFADRIFVAKGSGNDTSPNAIANCYAYNALCVGGYRHEQTIGPDAFSDDVIAGGSWANDVATGREEPDVVGSYFAIVPLTGTTTNRGPESGTSFATPSVLGLAALLVASNRSTLLGDPTLLRAVLMASALHPVRDLDAPAAPHIPRFDDGIDDKSGVGVPRGDIAMSILKDDQFYTALRNAEQDVTADGKLIFHGLTDQTVAPLSLNSGFQLPTPGMKVLRMHVRAGQTVRVILAWDQCENTSLFIDDALLADLDLVVTGAGQAWTNPSLVDNWEGVQFVAPATGEYRTRVHVSRWDPCGTTGGRETHVALAWAIEDLPAGLSPSPGTFFGARDLRFSNASIRSR